MAVRGYTLGVDWDLDGDTAGTLEDLTAGVGLARGRLQDVVTVSYGRDLEQAQGPVAAGTMTFAANDLDGALSPENTASPIAGLVLPGRPVTFGHTTDMVVATFGTAVTSRWPAADTGQEWTTTGGSASDYSSSGGTGRHSLGSVAVTRATDIGSARTVGGILGRVMVPVLATGAPIDVGVRFRLVDGSNYYLARLRIGVDGSVEAAIVRVLASSFSTLATGGVIAAHTAGAWYQLLAWADGPDLRVKAWADTDPEPVQWTVAATDTSHTAGKVGCRSQLNTGNTNTLPVVVQYDDIQTLGRTFFAGVADRIEPAPDTAAKTVSISCLDAWGRLASEPLSTAVHPGLRTGDAIGVILDEIGWTGGRDLDPGATVMPWWWAEGDAGEALEQLIDAEGPPAVAFVEAGVLVFRDRHHRVIRPQSLTSQGTFSHAAPAGSRPGTLKILKGAGYDHGLDRISNHIAISVDERRPAAQTQVWSTDDTITLTDGETVEIHAQATDPFMDAVTPVDGTDFTTSPGTVEVSLSRDSGQAVTILLKAVGGPASVLGLALRATPLPVARTHKVTAEDAGSIAVYGRQAWPRTIPWAGVADARAIADKIVATHAVNRPTITLSIAATPAMPAAYLTAILGRRISDRVTIINDESGLNADFFVEHITHEIFKLGARHTLTLGCRSAAPEQPDDVFRFNGSSGHRFDEGVFAYSGLDDPDGIFLFDGGSGHRFDEGAFAV